LETVLITAERKRRGYCPRRENGISPRDGSTSKNIVTERGPKKERNLIGLRAGAPILGLRKERDPREGVAVQVPERSPKHRWRDKRGEGESILLGARITEGPTWGIHTPRAKQVGEERWKNPQSLRTSTLPVGGSSIRRGWPSLI